jgi:hypothetical protein
MILSSGGSRLSETCDQSAEIMGQWFLAAEEPETSNLRAEEGIMRNKSFVFWIISFALICVNQVFNRVEVFERIVFPIFMMRRE